MNKFLMDCSFKQYSMAPKFDFLIQRYAILIQRYAILIPRYAAWRRIIVPRYAA
jgi:hypothetical protein